MYDGVTAPVLASVPKATFGAPLACSGVAGMAALWHSLQGTCLEKLGPPAAPVSRCFTWAPILVPPVSSPVASAGGADEKATRLASLPVRAGSPWQVVQVCVVYWIVPSTWVVAFTVVPVYPAWQAPQSVRFGWNRPVEVDAGGMPWQELHTSVAAVVQAGVTLVAPTPPPRLPWQ